jgi:hypothetical protein
MIQSGLHGDMQRVAEMSTSLRDSNFTDEFGESVPQRLKPKNGRLRAARLNVVPFPNLFMRESEGVTESSEIPCRVSSDLHEWRNESATVLPTDTANL